MCAQCDQRARDAGDIERYAEIRPRDDALSIARLDQFVAVLFSHGAKKMLGMLIEVLCFDGVAIHECGASQREIALVLPLGIGKGNAAAVLGLGCARP